MKEPAPVQVTNPDPIPVTIEGTDPSLSEVQQVARGRATESSLTSQGQREISRIWERTQQFIALAVVLTTLITAAFLVLSNADSSAAFTLLASLANLVIGFYFGRTNHARVGGVGGDMAGTR